MRGRQRGFALPAAIVALAVFALVALVVVDEGRGRTALLAGRMVQARLAAAADAGIALAIEGVARAGAARWPVDGRPHGANFDGVTLQIAVEDERGRLPLNALDGRLLRALLGALGLQGERRETLARTIEAARRRPFRAIGDMAVLPGMDGGLLTRLGPVLSFVPRADAGSVDARYAGPFVRALLDWAPVMERVPDGFPVLLARHQQDGATTWAADEVLAQKIVRVTVTAGLGARDRLTRMAVVEFTGDAARPFVVRDWQ
ncbi:hypothetical protein [Zavarzinia sp.]|uniref:hypothetical protein n=1 Tax=Zavarzinia sp. TaxID=2027920 RepID=UPI0035638ECD